MRETGAEAGGTDAAADVTTLPETFPTAGWDGDVGGEDEDSYQPPTQVVCMKNE